MRALRLVLFAAPPLLISLTASRGALAQSPPRPAPASAPASAPPSAPAPAPAAAPLAEPLDLVRFKNGGMVRGTILELVPGETVVIRTATGDVRKIPMADVTYAGAASAEKPAPTPAPAPAPAPPAPAPAPKPASNVRPMVTVHAGEARFNFESDVPQSTLYVQTATVTSSYGGVVGYERLCTAPCAATVAEGNYRFALAEGNKNPGLFSRSVDIHDGDTIRVTRESRRGTRITFGVVGLGGLGVGLPMIALGDRGSDTRTVGYVVLGASAVAFLIAATISDQLHFSVVPGVPAGDEPDPRAGRVSARPPASPRQEVTSSWQGLTAIGWF